MGKKESPKTKKTESFEPQKSGLSGKAFGIIKFILGISILPLVYSSTISFIREFNFIGQSIQLFFWSGIISFLILYLFIYEPVIIYKRGFRLVEIIFSFFSPLIKVAPYLLPVYAIIVFVSYLLLSSIFESNKLIGVFLFLLGFSFALHIVLSAKSVRAKQNDFLRANYIFGFSFIYITNFLILGLCLSFIFEKFSFINFFNSSFQEARNILSLIFRWLFL